MTINKLQYTLLDIANELGAEARKRWLSDPEASRRFRFFAAELSTLSSVRIDPEHTADHQSRAWSPHNSE